MSGSLERPHRAQSQPHPDRKAAEWVLSVGGSVRVNGQNRDIKVAANLPKKAFRLTGVSLAGNEEIEDGLDNLEDCGNLRFLDLQQTKVSAAKFAALKKSLPRCRISQARAVEPKAVEPKVNLVSDRKAAEYVLSVGGVVKVNGQDREIKTAADLPSSGFRLTSAAFLEKGLANDKGLACFAGCRNLTSLELHRSPVTDAGLAWFADCKNLTHLNLFDTKVTDAGLDHFKGCKNLTYLDVQNTRLYKPRTKSTL